MKTIWVINEGSPGHLAQSLALAQALKDEGASRQMTNVDVVQRFSGLQRGIMRRIIGRSGSSIPTFLEKRILQGMVLPEGECSVPDLILASGGKGVFAGRALANRFEVPFVFIGERKPYPSEWFHTVFTPSAHEQGENDILIDLIPTGVTPQKVAQAAVGSRRPEGVLWAMIIGGASRSHPYRDTDWQHLAEGMNQLAERYGIRWLLTTSRRTGASTEAQLKKHIQPTALADAIWWDANPEKRMMAFLGSAERVFVTQDSVTMVTECVASGKSVVVLRPQREAFPPNSFIPSYLNRLQGQGYFKRVNINRMISFDPFSENESAPFYSVTERMLAALNLRLK